MLACLATIDCVCGRLSADLLRLHCRSGRRSTRSTQPPASRLARALVDRGAAVRSSVYKCSVVVDNTYYKHNTTAADCCTMCKHCFTVAATRVCVKNKKAAAKHVTGRPRNKHTPEYRASECKPSAGTSPGAWTSCPWPTAPARSRRPTSRLTPRCEIILCSHGRRRASVSKTGEPLGGPARARHGAVLRTGARALIMGTIWRAAGWQAEGRRPSRSSRGPREMRSMHRHVPGPYCESDGSSMQLQR